LANGKIKNLTDGESFSILTENITRDLLSMEFLMEKVDLSDKMEISIKEMSSSVELMEMAITKVKMDNIVAHLKTI
jgi:hypothetical protein